MKYENAKDILPTHIIEILQGYVDGKYLYIPRKNDNKNLRAKKVDLEKS